METKGAVEVESKYLLFCLSAVTVNEGYNVTLNCTLSGDNISWTGPGNSRHQKGQSLSIPHIAREQHGNYMCHNSTLKENHSVIVECKCM